MLPHAVQPLVWLPGSPAGLILGEKLIHGVVTHGSPSPCNGSRLTPDTYKGSVLAPGPYRDGPCGPAMLGTGVVPVFSWLLSPETSPSGALVELPGFIMMSGEVLGLIGTIPLIFTTTDLKGYFHKLSQQICIDLSQITTIFLSVCPSPSGSLGLRYHVKTRERRGSSFSQLGLEPNHTGLTAQSPPFLEELCRVKRNDT